MSFGYFRNDVSSQTQRYRFTRYFRKAEPVTELYDHSIDPFKTKNMAADKPEIVEKLMSKGEKGNTGLYEKLLFFGSVIVINEDILGCWTARCRYYVVNSLFDKNSYYFFGNFAG